MNEDIDGVILYNITNKITAEIWQKEQSQVPHFETEYFVSV
jgi:hypothetical protein